METVQYLAQIQAYTGIGIGLIIGLGRLVLVWVLALCVQAF